MLLYYITDRGQFPGDEAARRRRLLNKIGEAARCGVNYIQLREKDLSSRALESLAREAVQVVRTQPRTENRELRTALLINSRTDVALASGADGVHLPADEISPAEARNIWIRSSGQSSNSPSRQGSNDARTPIIGVSCHSIEEVRTAVGDADFVVFGPVFGKSEPRSAATGLDALRQACAEKIPVFALGGVTLENAEACHKAGAAGVAAIRLFQENDIRTVVDALAGSSRA